MVYGFYIRFLDGTGDEMHLERHTFESLSVCREQAWKLLAKLEEERAVNIYTNSRVEVNFFESHE